MGGTPAAWPPSARLTVMAMSKTGCGFQRAAWLVHPDAAEDRHTPKWFCVVHLCWSSTPDLCPLQRAEAQIQRVRELLEPYVPCPSHDDDCDSVICALRLALGLPLDGDGDE